MMKSEDGLSRLRHPVGCSISQFSASLSFQLEFIDPVAFFPLGSPLGIWQPSRTCGLVAARTVVVLAQFHQKLTLKLTLRPRT